MSLRTLAFLGSALAFSLACGGGETTPAPAPPAPPVAPPPPPAPPVAAAPAGNGEVGVAECDEYIKKMTECLGTMDATVKAASESAFKQTTDAWRAAAATPEGKAGLATGCKAALSSIPPTCGGAAAAPGAAPAGGAATGTASPAPAGATAAGGTATATAGGTTVTATAGTGTAAVEVKTTEKAESTEKHGTGELVGSGGRTRPTHVATPPDDDDKKDKKKKKKKND